MRNRTTLLRAEQSRAEQSRAEQSRAEQSRAEQSRAEQSRAWANESAGRSGFAKMLSGLSESPVMLNAHEAGFKRTGKSDFALPADYDEHFDELNDEIAAMFMGERL